MPPLKVTDVPFADRTRVRDYRSYKLKFQAPPGTGLFTWRVIVVSDTYIAEDAAKDLQVSHFSYRFTTSQVADARIATGGGVHSTQCRGAA